MLRIVSRSVLAALLALGIAIPAVAVAPEASAAPNKAYLKMVWNCASVGDVTVTISGPGIKASGRHSSHTTTFQGRAGVYIVERLSNGRIASKKAFLQIPVNTTRTVLVCNENW
ncbi:hypothetical protein ACQPWY_14020 [Pseudonocardia xinjiangensis]|uniref:hypothetical protein n=1 Tax=Pseudonocardia xinjiangensis TaxID=75289 RepID=UPI003D8D339C